MWTYGANVDYIGCTFKGKGKFLHVYNEGLEAKTINIINNKTFKIGGYYVTSNEFKQLVSYRVR